MKDLKYSRQREAILDNLKSRVDHPTADMLFQSLRKDDPKISLGTVYRNLGLLAELGRINKISAQNGIERYDYNTNEHYHFSCKACSKLIDLPADISKNDLYGFKKGCLAFESFKSAFHINIVILIFIRRKFLCQSTQEQKQRRT